jgi:endonuclease YncB( thermonuclease family)
MQRGFEGFVFVFLVSLLFFSSSLALGGESQGLYELQVVRCVRPNLVVARVLGEGEAQKVRVKLAGISLPLEDEAVYRQAFARLRELVKGKNVYFDFALGHSSQESPWVGYVYLGEPSREETIVVNALLVREGLAALDEETAGRNMLGYLVGMQEEAKSEGLGLWRKKETKSRGKESEECPSCVIRSPGTL